MDTTLVTVTLLSMGMAAALSVIVWRMLRDERQRSEARVLALAQRAAQPSAGPAQRAAQPSAGPAQRAAQPPARDPVTRDLRHGTRTDSRETPDLVLRTTPVAAAPMFAEPQAGSPWGNRFAVMAGLALVLASGVLIALTATGGTSARQPRTATTAAAPGANTAVAGLELLSLRDARRPGSLTITGLVQNPRGGAALTRVTVTAYAFDDKGSFLASGRAFIDVTTLAPGDESPFVVSIPATETVARYRIGFRGEDGRVIEHVDKRQQPPVAALRPGSGQANW